jgi:Tfp pilus assembly protein PilV
VNVKSTEVLVVTESKRVQPSHAEGFTIVEAVIAVMVVAITAGAFIALSMSSLRELQMSTDYYRSVSLARNRIERIRMMDFDTILNLSEEEHRVDGNGNADVEGAYRRQTEITALTANLADITVTISFPDRPGRVVATPVVVRTKHARGM